MNPLPEFEEMFRCGFVTIIGAPNVGKSTLLNHLTGQKISITSRKPQTTRNRITGIVHRPHSQLIFLDTPGIHKADGRLHERIVGQALATISNVDAILLVIDASRPDRESETIIQSALKRQNLPAVLALNKIDLINKPDLLLLMDRWKNLHTFRAIVPVSALKGEQTGSLLDELEAILPTGPALFPTDSITDVSMRFLAAEIIREKVFRFTGEEIPYAVAVTIESYSEEPQKPLTRIHATIHVERDSQKGIIIGKGGERLKRIGETARKEIEELVETPVFLKLFVRIQKNWSRDSKALDRFGYG
jgi:GTP-binding protein Era